MRKSKCILLLFLLLAVFGSANSQTYVFAQLQGSPMNTTGWNTNGGAYVGDTPGDPNAASDELILTNPSTSNSGGIFYGQPINLTQCQKWTAEFDFRMFDGTGADGIALCFLQVPPVGFVSGDGVGIPAGANGLKVVFDTYQNDGGYAASPEIQIRYGNGYHQFNPPFNSQPTLQNTGGQLNYLRSNAYQSARVTYDNGNIEVYVNGILQLTGYYVINFTGYLGFTSSTGAFTDRNSIKNVTIYTQQAPSDAGPNAGVAYCSGNSVQIGTTPNPDFVYSWSPATGLNQTNIANPTVTLTNNTSNPITQIYTVTTTLAATPGVCPSTDNITVTINPTPTSTFTLPDSACVGQPVAITHTGNMNGAATFNWNFGGGTVISGSGIGPYQVSWATGGDKQVSLSVSKYGCNSTQTRDTIKINQAPTSTFIKPNEVCEGAEITVSYTGNGSAAANYVWNFDGGTVNAGTNSGPYQVEWPSTGLKNLSLTVTENGCTSPATTDTIRVHSIPVAQLSIPQQMCLGDTILIGYAGDTTALSTYYSNWSGGMSIPIYSNPNLGYEWTSNTAGTFSFIFSIDNHGCHSDTITDSITVYAIPTATFTASPEVCLGTNTNITYTGTGSTNATYVWNYAPATLQSGTGQGPLDVRYAAAGNYSISLTVSEGNCVSATETVDATVHAVPTSTFNVATGICVGQTSPLTYTGTGSASATFDWSFDGVEVISGVGIGPYILGDANLGSFAITLQVMENNCQSTVTTHTFEVLPTPDVDFSATPLIGCNPLPVDFTNQTPAQAGIVYAWDFGDGGSSTQENPAYIYNNAGSFTITLTATNGYGCSASETKSNYVNVTPQPVAGFSILPEQVTMDNPVVDVVDNSKFAETYIYTMGDGTVYTQAEPSHSYVSEGEYEVVQVVSNSLGCTNKASIIVTVLPFTNVFIPNSFTPTGDNLNEVWMPSISYITQYELRIFDRWGGLVYETDDLFSGWNGNYFNYGKAVEAGQYAYKIVYRELSSNKTRELMGNIVLVR